MKGGYFLLQDKFWYFNSSFFASWGIFYFLEILNQVIHSLMGLITCLSSRAELPFQQHSPCSVSNSAHGCARAITTSFKRRIQEISSNTNKVVALSGPALCSFYSCPYDAFWFCVLVGKQMLALAAELCCIRGICEVSLETRVSPPRAKGISENAAKCINNQLGIKSKNPA